MAFCTKCGAQIKEGANVCEFCNTPVEGQQNNQQNTQQQEYQQQQGYQQAPFNSPAQVNNTGMIVWSIINLILCCLPLGIVGLIFSINAKNQPTYEQAQEHLKKAKTWNLVGTIVGAVVEIIAVIIYVVALGAALSNGGYY